MLWITLPNQFFKPKAKSGTKDGKVAGDVGAVTPVAVAVINNGTLKKASL
jgi:hypothetical protein